MLNDFLIADYDISANDFDDLAEELFLTKSVLNNNSYNNIISENILSDLKTEKINFVLDHIKDIVFQTDISGHWTYLNPAWEQITGFSAEDSLGKYYLDFVHRDFKESVRSETIKLVNGQIDSVNLHTRYINSTNDEVYVDIYSQVILDENNLPIGTIGIIKDISEQTIADQNFKSIKERNSALLQSIPDLFLILDTQGVIIDYNIADKSKMIFNTADLINNSIFDIFPSIAAKKFEESIKYSIENDILNTFEYSLDEFSKINIYEARISKLSDNQAIALIRNIEKQKTAESKLAELNALHLIINEISSNLIQSQQHNINNTINDSLAKLGKHTNVDRVYIFDFDLDFLTCNNIFEWVADGIQPKIINLQGLALDVMPRWLQKFNLNEYIYIPSISCLDDEYSAEREFLEPLGIKSILISPMLYGNSLIGFLGFDSIKDFKEWEPEIINLLKLSGDIFAGSIYRFNFENQLIEQKRIAEDANRAKSEFLANMSHEIRTPMNAILGFSEILLGLPLGENERNYSKTIFSSAKNLLSLINDILDLSKIESGKIDLHYEPMSVRVLFHEINHIFAQKVLEKNLKLNISIQDGFPEAIVFDEIRLRQILFNIVGNAVKFTDSGEISVVGDITYGLGNGIVDIRFRIHDTGIGIDDDCKESIFDSFRQADSRNNRRFEGTGLGLAITKKLVDALGGNISVKSKVGVGSEFEIIFRKIKVSYESLSNYNTDTNKYFYEFKHSNILVVDDIEHNRQLVKSYLKEFDFTVVEASNGQEAIDLIKIKDFDLVLMDLRMPFKDGYSATDEIKSSLNFVKPVIAFTASSMTSDRERIDSIFDDYLQKPIAKNDLILCLTKYIEHRRFSDSSELLFLGDSDVNMLVAKNLTDSIDHVMLRKFIKEFDFEYRSRISEILDFFDSETIEELLNGFNRLADDHGIEAFTDITNKMKEAASNFDIEILKECTWTIVRSIEYCKKIL